MWKNKQFLSLVKEISGSTSAYQRYNQSKNHKKRDSKLPVAEAEKLRDYVLKKTKEIRKWLKGRRD